MALRGYTALFIVALLVAAACSSTEDQLAEPRAGAETRAGAEPASHPIGIPWVDPVVPAPKHGVGVAIVDFHNRSDDPVTLSHSVKNDSNCPSNGWEQGNDSGIARGDTFPPLDPGASGKALMSTNACTDPNQGTFIPHQSEGAFAVGLSGSAQFEFALHYSFWGNFDEFRWSGSYADDNPDTGGLVMVECGTDQYLGTGFQGLNVGAEYKDHGNICFEYWGAPPSMEVGQHCTAKSGETVNCQVTQQLGTVNDNINVVLDNDSDIDATVSYVGLHGAQDQVTVDSNGSAKIGLGAGHFGLLTLEPAADGETSVSVASMTST